MKKIYKIKTNNLIPAKVDNANTRVTICKQKYSEKINDSIRTENLTQALENPANKFDPNFKNGIDNCTFLCNQREKHNVFTTT